MPHKETYTEFTPDQYPPFPDSSEFPTIELQTISLKKLQDGDQNEQDRIVDACKNWGFFYLELPGTEQGEVIANGADDICRLAEKTFQLPIEDKLKLSVGGDNRKDRTLFGYKKIGWTVTDKNATPDTAEFFNIGKNDMLVPESQTSIPYPRIITDNKPLLKEYCTTAHSIGLQIVDVLMRKLGIDPEEIYKRHRFNELAGDHIRMTRGPPRKTLEMPEIQTPSHTDFGTITILMNWLGGLQLFGTPNRVLGNLSYDDAEANAEGRWLWVRPKKNCAIINLGDAAVKFTNGALCSGRHRVVPAPGEQGKWPRYSIVYFVRPEDNCRLKALTGEEEDEEGEIAREWIFKQSVRLTKGQ